jgi:hypothetical protein
MEEFKQRKFSKQMIELLEQDCFKNSANMLNALVEKHNLILNEVEDPQEYSLNDFISDLTKSISLVKELIKEGKVNNFPSRVRNELLSVVSDISNNLINLEKEGSERTFRTLQRNVDFFKEVIRLYNLEFIRRKFPGYKDSLKHIQAAKEEIDHLKLQAIQSREIISQAEISINESAQSVSSTVEEVNKLIETVSQVQKSICESQEDINSIKDEITLTNENINQIKNDCVEAKGIINDSKDEIIKSQEKINEVETHVNESQRTINAAKKHSLTVQESINLIETNAEKSQATIDAIQTEVSESQKEIKDTENKVIKSFGAVELNLANIRNKEKELSNLISRTEELFSGIEEKSDELKDLITKAIGNNLFGAFNERKKHLETAVNWWLAGSTIVLLGFLWFTIWIFSDTTGPLHLNIAQLSGNNSFFILLLKFSLSSPFISALWFSLLRYSKERRLVEEYAFKSVISISLKPYFDLINETEEIANKRFLISAIEDVFDSPLERVFKTDHKDMKDLNNQLNQFSAVEQTLKNFNKQIVDDK